MKNNNNYKDSTSQNGGEQVARKENQGKPYEVIKLGIDWHADHLRVVRMIDESGPEPAQRFKHEDFLKWVARQLSLAAKVYTCYEAGAGGYVLHRQLTEKGATNYVVVARKLDPAFKGVQTDRTDARELTQNLDRYVRGNKKAMQVVRVPTPEEEQKRALSRQRHQICRHRHAVAAQGCSLLLSQGLRYATHLAGREIGHLSSDHSGSEPGEQNPRPDTDGGSTEQTAAQGDGSAHTGNPQPRDLRLEPVQQSQRHGQLRRFDRRRQCQFGLSGGPAHYQGRQPLGAPSDGRTGLADGLLSTSEQIDSKMEIDPAQSHRPPPPAQTGHCGRRPAVNRGHLALANRACHPRATWLGDDATLTGKQLTNSFHAP